MDFQIRPKTDLSISDNKHMENSIISDFISFNMYKSRILKQFDELAGTTNINGETYFTTLNLHNQLSAGDSPQRKLLTDLGFTDAVIQDIIDFNNAEDLDYLRLAWKYKFAIHVEVFTEKIDELRIFLGTANEIRFYGSYDNIQAEIDNVLIDTEIGQMLYGLSKTIYWNYDTLTIETGDFGVWQADVYTLASIVNDITGLFELLAEDSEIYEAGGITGFGLRTIDDFLSENDGPQIFWKAYKIQNLEEYMVEDNKMFYLHDYTITDPNLSGFPILPTWNNPFMWLNKDIARSTRKEEWLRDMSKFMTIDYKVDEGNWLERFVSGLINAILGLIGAIVDLVASIPVLGDIFEFIVENIGKLFGLESFEEAIVYLKQILLVVISLVIAYYSGDFSYTQAAIAGWGTAATYAVAFLEVAGAIGSILGAIDTAEAQWNLMEKAKRDDIDKELEEDQSPENRMADTDAPDREQDYLYEQMFTVPDWSIDHSMTLSDEEPPMKFLNI